MSEEDVDLSSVFSINPDDINSEFVTLPGNLGYWSAKYSEAFRSAALAKANEKQVRAVYREVARERATASKSKPALPDIEAQLEAMDEVQDAVDVTIEAEYEKNRLGGIVDAIRSKRDMLISLGAQLRAEMQRDPTINKPDGDHSWGGSKS